VRASHAETCFASLSRAARLTAGFHRRQQTAARFHSTRSDYHWPSVRTGTKVQDSYISLGSAIMNRRKGWKEELIHRPKGTQWVGMGWG